MPGYWKGDLEKMDFLVGRDAETNVAVKPVRRRMMSPGWKEMFDSAAMRLNVDREIAWCPSGS